MENISFKIEIKSNTTYIDCIYKNNSIGQIKFELHKNSKDLFDDKITKSLYDTYIGKNPFIYLSYISVLDNFKRKGIGKKLMNKFLSLKSIENKKILLYALPFKNDKLEPINKEYLELFYIKNNFKIIHKDYSSTLMIR